MKDFLVLIILILAGFGGYLMFKPAPTETPVQEAPAPIVEEKPAGLTRDERIAAEKVRLKAELEAKIAAEKARLETEWAAKTAAEKASPESELEAKIAAQKARLETELEAKIVVFTQTHQKEIDNQTQKFAALLSQHLEKDAAVLIERQKVPNRKKLRDFKLEQDGAIDKSVKNYQNESQRDHRGRYYDGKRESSRNYRDYLRSNVQKEIDRYEKQLDSETAALADRFREEYGKANRAAVEAYQKTLTELLNQQTALYRAELEKSLASNLKDFETKLDRKEAPAAASPTADPTVYVPQFPPFQHVPRNMINLNYE